MLKKANGSTSVSAREKRNRSSKKRRFIADAKTTHPSCLVQDKGCALYSHERQLGGLDKVTIFATWVRIKDSRERMRWLASLLYVTLSDTEAGSRREGK